MQDKSEYTVLGDTYTIPIELVSYVHCILIQYGFSLLPLGFVVFATFVVIVALIFIFVVGP